MTDEQERGGVAVHNNAPVGTQIIAMGPSTFVVATPLTWERLMTESRAWENDISSDLAGRVCLARSSTVTQLRSTLENSRVSVVLGESGTGKSALVRRAIAHLAAPSRVVLYASDAIDFERNREPALSSLLATPPASSGYLVLDAIDRIDDDDGVRALARIVRALGLAGASQWKLALTCGRDAWQRLAPALDALGALLPSPGIVSVPRLAREDIAVAAATFPPLARLLSRVELQPLASQTKVLDLLACASIDGSLPASTGWVGESDVVAWFSETYVRPLDGNVAQAATLQRLARDQADASTFATPLADLGSDAAAIPPLVAKGILVVRDEVVRFAHDLYADYARARWLVAEVQSSRWDSVRQRAQKRLWRRSVRLLFTDRLERSSDTTVRDAWVALRAALNVTEVDAGMDLLLEASTLSTAATKVLPAITPELFNDDGALLRRMLTRFLFAASFPHPAVVAAVSGNSRRARLLAEASYQLPDPPLWLPVLRWLVSVGRRAIGIAPDETLALLEAWLWSFRQIPSWPLLPELAELVLAMVELDAEQHYQRRDERRRLYSLLLAVASLADRSRCSAVLRARAGLVAPPPPLEPARDPSADVSPELQYLLHSFIARESVGPWPGGPILDPDDDLAAVALAEPGASLLVAHDAALAQELFAALLISPPHERDPHDLHRGDGELRRCDETKPSRDFPPIRALLEHDAARGLDLSVFLLNFATDRWREMAERRQGQRPALEEDVLGVEISLPSGPRAYDGGQRVFLWNLGSGPQAACATALTLEEWLTKHARDGTLDSGWLQTLLEASHSTTMLGVLIDVALLKPELLEEATLEPLTTTPLLAMWTSHRQVQLQIDRFSVIGARERPYLHLALTDLVVPILAGRHFAWPAVEESRRRWESRLAQIPQGEIRDYVEKWVDLLNPERWTPSQESPIGYAYQESEALGAKQRRAVAAAEEHLGLLSFSHRCEDVIEGRLTWTEEQLSQVLAAVAGPLPIDAEIEAFVGGAVALRCEVAAVALLCFDGWLAQRPDERARCVEWLLAPLELPVVPGTVFARDDVSTDSWEVLCARALPQLLSGEPSDPRLRRAIARLAVFPHAAAVRAAVAGARRAMPSNDFSALLHFGVRVARRALLRDLVGDGRHGVASLDRADDLDIAAFVGARLEPLPRDWRRIAEIWPRGFDSRFRQNPHAHGFDEALVLTLFAWLDDDLAGPRALDHIELVEQLSAPLIARLSGPWTPPFSIRRWGRDIVKQVTGPFRKKTTTNRFRATERWHPDGPFESDEIPIKWTATLILRAEKPEDRRRLWERWLRLPLESDFWIERLFAQLYRNGFDMEDAEVDRFTTLLREILGFIETEGWLKTSRRHSAFKVVMAALGGGSFVSLSARWKASRADVAGAISSHVAVFVERAHEWPGCFAFACELLLAPAFEPQQLDALSWLGRAATDEVLADDDVATPLAHLLDAISQRPRDQLAAKREAQTHFDRLLGMLEARQHPVALALGRRIAGGGRS